MKKEYAVLGLGNFGQSVALTLQELGCEVIAVDRSEERVQRFADHVSYAMKADIADPEVIKTLGARNLDGVIIAVAEDMESSIMATLACSELGVPMILAKANNEVHAKILEKIGANIIIYPERETGERVAKQLLSANFTDWISLSPDFSIIETKIPRAWEGKSLEELKLREIHDISVVGTIVNGQMEVNPNPKSKLPDNCIMIIVGSNSALELIQRGNKE
ncbi:MAG: potassium channel family protein [Suipraeoptans sp.]